MKKILLISTAALIAAHASHGESSTLFSSSFAPSEGGHAFAQYAPGWNPDNPWEWSAGSYPEVIWQEDADRTAPGSNGYFKEVVRDGTNNVDQGGFSSNRISTIAFEGEPITVTFNFKLGANPAANDGIQEGRLDFRLLEFDSAGATLPSRESWITLVNGGQKIGESAPPGDNDFDHFEVSDIGDGWVTVELSRSLLSNTVEAILWFEPWTLDGPENFGGSYGVDDVSLASGDATGETPAGLEIARAIEVEFFTEEGRNYRIESSPDSVQWVREGGLIQGNGEIMRRVFAASESANRDYRVVVE